jgi:hypothetical protein
MLSRDRRSATSDLSSAVGDEATDKRDHPDVRHLRRSVQGAERPDADIKAREAASICVENSVVRLIGARSRSARP